MKHVGIYRINDFSLLKSSFDSSQNKDFLYVNSSQLNESVEPNTKQYIEISSVSYDENDQIINLNSRLDNIVWNYGSSNYKRRQNSNYGNDVLFQPNLVERNIRYYSMTIFIRQCFNWENLYGLHLIVKGIETGNVYTSKIIKTNDLTISNDKIRTSGTYWLEGHKFDIPFTEENLLCQVTKIKFAEISYELNNIGYLYNYPSDMIPLLDSKPYPDFIVTNLKLDINNFLHIETITNESKTLEKSIKDYFGIKENELSNIKIEYLIQYSATNVNTGEIDEFAVIVSNNYNTYNKIVYGFNLYDYINYDNPNQIFDISVETIITIDNKIMKRNSYISMDFSSVILSMSNRYIEPSTTKIIKVEEVTNVEQVVVNTQKKVKFVEILQPILVEMVSTDFKYDKKYITFDWLNEKCSMIVYSTNEQTIFSKSSSDSKYYFDLSELIPLTENCKYKIINDNSVIISDGNITI